MACDEWLWSLLPCRMLDPRHKLMPAVQADHYYFIEEFSGKANDAVFNLDDAGEEGTDDQEDGDNETTNDEHSDDDEDEIDVTGGSRFTAIMVSMWSWQRPAVDMS